MANANSNGIPSPVLPLPPLEYDVSYMNNLIRLLNYYIEQQSNLGLLRAYAITLDDGDGDSDFVVNTRAYNSDILKVLIKELPTSAAGLESGQVWRDAASANVLKIVP